MKNKKNKNRDRRRNRNKKFGGNANQEMPKEGPYYAPRFFSPVPPSYPPNMRPSHSCDCHGMRKPATADILSQYLFCYIYIWLNDADVSTSAETDGGFWAYPIMIDGNFIHTYIWDGYEWVYTYFDLSDIAGFY